MGTAGCLANKAGEGVSVLGQDSCWVKGIVGAGLQESMPGSEVWESATQQGGQRARCVSSKDRALPLATSWAGGKRREH